MLEETGLLGAFIIVAAIYFLPTVVAGMRGHPNGTPIFLLNLFLGWTFIGWLVSLIWSSSAIAKQVAQPVETQAQNGRVDDPYRRLEQLADLKERGHLGPEEFEVEKAKILKS